MERRGEKILTISRRWTARSHADPRPCISRVARGLIPEPGWWALSCGLPAYLVRIYCDSSTSDFMLVLFSFIRGRIQGYFTMVS